MKVLLMGTHWDALNLPDGVKHVPHEHKWRVNAERTKQDPLGRPYCTVCGGKPSFFSLRLEDEQSNAVQASWGSVKQKREIIVEADPFPGRVVHCKKEDHDVYIGRGSKWGNPYSHKEGTSAKWIVDSREDAVRLYEEWIRSQPELMEAAKKELKGKVLGCWCAPLACHGDVLLKIANEE